MEIGLNPNFSIMTATDQLLFLKQHLYRFGLNYYLPLGNPTKFIQSLITFFSRLADEDISPIQFKSLIKSEKNKLIQLDEVEYERLIELSEA